MARVLVLGGAGYVGSHTVKALVKEKHTVLVVDDLSTGYKKLAKFSSFRKGSLCNSKFLENTVKKFRPQAIFHFANCSLVGESVRNPAKYFTNNVVGTINLLNVLVKHKIFVPFIFSSSCAVYGEPQGPLVESHPQKPLSPYGVCKKMVEEILVEYENSYSLPFVALRYFNAAGADPDAEIGEMHDPETHLIPRLLQVAKGKESKKDKIQILGDDYNTPDGTCVRDYIHVMDLANAHLKAWDYLRSGGKSVAVNLGSGNGYSVKEIIRMVQKVTGKKIQIPVGPRRMGDPASLVASSQLAFQLWGWKPKYDLEKIISTAWKWAERT